MAAIAQISGAAPADPTANVVDAAGHLRVPADYRNVYQALGSWAIAANSGQGSKEMHAVYASPGAIDAYRKTGHFPDGAVLVKEVFAGRVRDEVSPLTLRPSVYGFDFLLAHGPGDRSRSRATSAHPR